MNEENFRIGMPLFCDLIVSHNCFFKCKMCMDWKSPSNLPLQTFDECKRFIDGLSEFIDYRLDINIMGGEPFMIDWLLPLCDYIHSKGFNSIVSTNGYLIDEEMAKKIADSNLGVLAISLDGMVAGTHDSIRGKEGAYEQVVKALGYLSKYNKGQKNVTILTLILKQNLKELTKIVNWAKDQKVVDTVSFLALLDSGLAQNKQGWFRQPEYANLWPQDKEELIKVMDALIDLKKSGHKINNPFSQLEAFKDYYNDPEKFLQETEYCIHDYIIDLDPNGEIFLSGHRLGSIKDRISVESLWFSEEANKIRRYIDLNGCDSSRSCMINFICAFKQDGSQSLDHYAQLAYSYQARGRYDLALVNFLRALRANPDNAKLHAGKAYNSLKLKDYKVAVTAYQKAFELEPGLLENERSNYLQSLRSFLLYG